MEAGGKSKGKWRRKLLLLLLRSLQVKSSGAWGEASGGVGVGTVEREVWVGERENWVREREAAPHGSGRGRGRGVCCTMLGFGWPTCV